QPEPRQLPGDLGLDVRDALHAEQDAAEARLRRRAETGGRPYGDRRIGYADLAGRVAAYPQAGAGRSRRPLAGVRGLELYRVSPRIRRGSARRGVMPSRIIARRNGPTRSSR